MVTRKTEARLGQRLRAIRPQPGVEKVQARGSASLQRFSHLDFPRSSVGSHEMLRVRLPFQLFGIQAAERVGKPPLPVQLLIGEFDHQRIRPGLRPHFEEAGENPFLAFRLIGLRHQYRHGGR
jgi:hypothetical protein